MLVKVICYTKKAAHNQLDAGIISIPQIKYHSGFWSLSVHGICFVLNKFVGYLYALVL
jgi:hypothetical protein